MINLKGKFAAEQTETIKIKANKVDDLIYVKKNKLFIRYQKFYFNQNKFYIKFKS